uniref:PID domain-containing protein n=1 Tax=Dromaius novaehollandiae TaxID=8790 RepID=A0A8C4JHX3_DRONO
MGMDVLNEAIEKLTRGPGRERWTPSLISVSDTAMRVHPAQEEEEATHIWECQVRYVTFIGVGRDAHTFALIVDMGQRFQCTAFWCEPDAGTISEAVQAACMVSGAPGCPHGGLTRVGDGARQPGGSAGGQRLSPPQGVKGLVPKPGHDTAGLAALPLLPGLSPHPAIVGPPTAPLPCLSPRPAVAGPHIPPSWVTPPPHCRACPHVPLSRAPTRPRCRACPHAPPWRVPPPPSRVPRGRATPRVASRRCSTRSAWWRRRRGPKRRAQRRGPGRRPRGTPRAAPSSRGCPRRAAAAGRGPASAASSPSWGPSARSTRCSTRPRGGRPRRSHTAGAISPSAAA